MLCKYCSQESIYEMCNVCDHLIRETIDIYHIQHPNLSPEYIPTANEHTFKTQLVLERNAVVRTIKINWWHEDDDRGEPHNHPWDFSSEILSGGYTEERYWIGDDGDVCHEVLVFGAGDVNTITRDMFHRVINVQPGTVTRMTCGPAVLHNGWGYLDSKTGVYTSADEKDVTFMERLKKSNSVQQV